MTSLPQAIKKPSGVSIGSSLEPINVNKSILIQESNDGVAKI